MTVVRVNINIGCVPNIVLVDLSRIHFDEHYKIQQNYFFTAYSSLELITYSNCSHMMILAEGQPCIRLPITW